MLSDCDTVLAYGMDEHMRVLPLRSEELCKESRKALRNKWLCCTDVILLTRRCIGLLMNEHHSIEERL